MVLKMREGGKAIDNGIKKALDTKQDDGAESHGEREGEGLLSRGER